MTGYALPRREPRYTCNEDVRFLITRRVNGTVRIIESEGLVVERSQSGLRVQCGTEILTGDTVLVEISGETASSSLYSPYNIVWNRAASDGLMFGCRFNAANDPAGILPQDPAHAPALSREAEETFRHLRHDVSDNISALSMALDFLKLEHGLQNRASEYLDYADKALSKVIENMQRLSDHVLKQKKT